MSTRAETAAATRHALLAAAGRLLDEGGLDAVTLRAVGSEAGLSRGAPYSHFSDKEELLTALAIARWSRLSEELAQLQRDESLSAGQRLTGALLATLAVARDQPHLYALMFTAPARNPETLIAAAAASQDEFLTIVAAVVGEQDARRWGALLLSSTHGIASLELSGQLSEAKWGTTSSELVDMLLHLAQR